MFLNASNITVQSDQHRHELLADAETFRLARLARAARRASRRAEPPVDPPPTVRPHQDRTQTDRTQADRTQTGRTQTDRLRENYDANRRYAVTR